MKNKLLILILATSLLACSQENLIINSNESSYSINFIETLHSPNADSIYHQFNILNHKTGNKEFSDDINDSNIDKVLVDKNVTVGGIRKLSLSNGTIPEKILVSLLIDRSVHTEDMYNIQNAVRNIVDNLPDNSVYISFFDERLRETKKITDDNFETFENEFSVTKNNKIIFDAALVKFQELCGVGGSASNSEFSGKINDDDVKKVLVILSDGRVDANNQRTADNIQRFSEIVQQLDDDKENNKRIEIHAIRYGEKNDDVDFTLSYLCVDIRNENVKGGTYFADPVAFIESLRETDSSIPDYELVLVNPKGKVYQGGKKHTGLSLTKNNLTISGSTQYVVGTLLTPIKTSTGNKFVQLVYGLIWGLVLIGICFLLLQILLPYIRFRKEGFNKNYVRRYSFDEDTVIKCHYCLNEIRDGEEIVTKCHHTVHKHCWVENGCKCTEYGKNCKKGKQYLYDVNKPFSINNRPYFTKWAMYGMSAGLLFWLVFQLIISLYPAPLRPFTNGLLSIFYSSDLTSAVSMFYNKSGALLLIGLFWGFTMTLLFSLLNKSRQRKKDSVLLVLLRSFVGAILVFISFLIGAILCILCNAYANNIWVDWVPWLLSGGLLGIVLFYRTNIVWKQILPGGIISGLLCFLIILTGKWFGIYSVLSGLMFFGAGLGVSFISARHIIHKYFLKFKGEKEEKIAIHKWMSVAGGSNEVSIGNSEDATIRMNWDDHPSIQDINVKLYFDKKNRLPCIKILSNNVTCKGIFAKKNDEFLLKDGMKFTIGNTEFQYEEEQ